MFEQLYSGKIIYEIIFDKEPYILDWEINTVIMLADGVFLPDKFIGISTINESMIGTIIFFSYEEAQKRLDCISKRGE